MSESSSTTSPNSSRSLEFRVPEMEYPSYASKVTNSVERLEGIDDLDVRVTSGRLVVEYDPTRTTDEEIRNCVRATSYEVASIAAERTFAVPDMDCASCASKVKNVLEATTV